MGDRPNAGDFECAQLDRAGGVARSLRSLVPDLCFLPDRAALVDRLHLAIGSPWFESSTILVDLVIEGRAPLLVEEGAAWAAAHVTRVVNALAKGPGPAISQP